MPDIVDVARELGRMCRSRRKCNDCDLFGLQSNLDLGGYEVSYRPLKCKIACMCSPVEASDTIMKWAMESPGKQSLDPSAPKQVDDSINKLADAINRLASAIQMTRGWAGAGGGSNPYRITSTCGGVGGTEVAP